MTQVFCSVRSRSRALILVKPTRTRWKFFKKTISGVELSFLTRTLKGIGSWAVRIGGSGSRPSILIRGGGPDGGGALLKRVPEFRCSIAGEN